MPPVVTDGGRPIEEIAADQGLEPGVAPYGDKTHLVRFDSQSPLVLGTDDAEDQCLCGRVGNYTRADAPDEGEEWCDPCLDRLLSVQLGLSDQPEMLTDGGIETSDRYRDGEHVVCTRGHVHHIDDLDKNGMDYACPECFAFIDSGQVTDAKYGRNEIDERYLDEGADDG